MWSCGACSYAENVDARSRCALCDAVKPPSAITAPQPTGPNWSCGSCTLENKFAASTCVACGSAKPAAFQATRAAPPAQPIRGVPVPTKPAAAAPAPAAAAATPSAAPARPAASASSPASNNSTAPAEASINFLMTMGFERARCIAALQVKRDPNDALDWLLNQDAHAKPAAAPAAAKPAAASKPAASSSSAAKPTAAAPAAAAASALKPLSASEQKAFEEREAKRLELLKLLEEEAAAKVKARTQAAAATLAPPASATATKKTTGPVSASAPPPPSSTSASASSSGPFTSLREDPAEQRLRKLAEERAAEVERVALSALRVKNRLQAEAKLKDIPAVCRSLASNYDAARYEAIVSMVRRILDKVIADKGATDRFRRIPLANPKLEHTLVRPIGAIWILKQAGFEEQVTQQAASSDAMDTSDGESAGGAPKEEQRVLYLPAAKVDMQRLAQVSRLLGQQLASQSSGVPAIFASILSSGKYPVEAVYHLALELRLIVHNIIVSADDIDQQNAAAAAATAMTDDASPSSASRRRGGEGVNKNFRTLDKHESSYVHRIKPIVESKRILAELGFALDPHDLARQYLVVPLEALVADHALHKYQLILRELNAVATRLQASTPIAVGLRQLCGANRQKATERFMGIFTEALRVVLRTPHEQRYHKLVLDKVQAKVGTGPNQLIHGMSEFAQLFGFVPQTDDDGAVDPRRVALPYPGFDVELLQLRLTQLEQDWQQLLDKAASESTGIASSWSFV